MKTKKYNDSKQQTASRLSSVIFSLSTLLFLAACTADEEAMRPTTEGDFLTATATAPAQAFGSLSRALPEGYSGLTLHYTSAQTDALTAYVVAGNSITPSNNNNVTTLSFTTKGDGTETSPHLVWPQIKSGTPLYLTVSTTGEEKTQLWGTCTATEHGAALYFGELKPRHAKLSVAVTVKSTTALTTTNTLTVSAAIQAAAKTATDASTQAWPTTGEAVATPIGEATALTITDGTDSKQGAATVSGIFAPQTLEEPLIFAYADGSWTLDLSKIAVTGGTEGQMANQLVAGQHLTVSVTLNMTTLGTPTVTLTGISAAATDSYTGGLNGAATYTVTYGENTVTCADLNALTDALTAAITASATNISITGSISSFAEEAIMDVADDVTLTINGSTAYYINGSNEALRQNIAAAVTAGAKAITVSGDLTTDQLTAVKNGISGGTGIHLSLPQTTAIEDNAFRECSALTEITLEDEAVIGNYAFFRCENLTTVNGTLSGTIGNEAFYKCTALTEITLAEGAVIGVQAFCNCTSLETVEGTLSGTIGTNAFSGCTALTEITLADGAEIGESAFYNCTSLETVNGTLSGTIGDYAFSECTALTEITLADGTEIGDLAFYNCTSLTTVNGTLSGTIGNYAFLQCSALTEITLGDDVTVIGQMAFYGCTGMTSLTLQGVVTEVGTDAFSSVGYKNGAYNCALTLASGQADVEGLAPDVENKTWANNTWKSITITNTNE